MIAIWWLLPAAMVGVIIGALMMGIFSIASEQDDRDEKRWKREHGGIR